ncbi:MAG: BTAD domain-containing putative transcriptional regulator [Pseudooceanicola sp.]
MNVQDRPRLRISLLGPFRAEHDGAPLPISSQRAKALLALLALSPNRVVTREGAAAALWPDRDEPQARASLRQELSNLRKSLGPEAGAFLAVHRDRVELVPGAPVQFDTDWSGGLPDRLAGPLLQDVDLRSDAFEDWRRHQNAALTARFVARLEAETEAAAEAGDWPRALDLADRVAEADPLNEVAVAARMRAALASGRRPEAMRLFRDHEARVEAEYGAPPGAGLSALLETPETAPQAAGPPGRSPRLFDRPTVLLFATEATSRDPDDAILAEGMTDELRLGLSYWRWFPVIGPEAIGWKTARESDLRAVAESVGATFAVSSSVRRAGERVRVSAALTDARDGRLIWSEAFDGKLEDIFAFQEEVSRAIVARLEPHLTRAEGMRLSRASPSDLTAWQLLARAQEVERNGGEGYGTKDANLARRALFEEATAIEPDFARAWSRLGSTWQRAFLMDWEEDRVAAVQNALDCTARAIDLDPHDWEGHAFQGLSRIFGLQDFDNGVFHATESARLNPSAALARHASGCSLEWIGRFDEAIEDLEAIFRLNPNHVNRAAVLGDITTSALFSGRRDLAIDTARQLVTIAPGYYRGLQRCLATFGETGESDLAAKALGLLLEAQPDFSEQYVRDTYPFQNGEDLERFLEALRKGGWNGG